MKHIDKLSYMRIQISKHNNEKVFITFKKELNINMHII